MCGCLSVFPAVLSHSKRVFPHRSVHHCLPFPWQAFFLSEEEGKPSGVRNVPSSATMTHLSGLDFVEQKSPAECCRVGNILSCSFSLIHHSWFKYVSRYRVGRRADYLSQVCWWSGLTARTESDAIHELEVIIIIVHLHVSPPAHNPLGVFHISIEERKCLRI